MIGETVRRKEDARFLTGQGRYVEDIQFPDLLYLGFVRSPHGHANVRGIDASAALAVPGVVGVYWGNSLPGFEATLPGLFGTASAGPSYVDKVEMPPHPVFPTHITYVGEQVAVVVAESPYAAADGVDAVQVEYEVLAALTDWNRAMEPDAPPIHAGYSNRVAHLKHSIGEVDAELANADMILERRFDTASLKAVAIEGRGIAARWDENSGSMEVWSTTQMHYSTRDKLAQVLGITPDQVRVIARDIGGGFGLKGAFYPEDIVAPVLARHLKRPVRWTETRLEHMLTSNHSGRQTHDIKVAFDRDGRIRAMDLVIYKEVGSYCHFEMMLATNTVNHLPTHYKIPALRVEGWGILTNTPSASPYRGAGRVEAVFTMDRVLDAIARETGLDPVEVRRRNIVRREDMPYRSGLIYRDGVPVCYDNLDFERLLEAALEKGDYAGWRRRQADAKAQGRRIGIGIGSYVEAGGIGPCEGATITIHGNGRIAVKIGVNSQGQSHETTQAQICAQALDADYDQIDVLGGDTKVQRIGFGTGASRVAINTGNAVHMASLALRAKVVTMAAKLLKCEESEIEISRGRIGVRGGRPDVMGLGELAMACMRHPYMAALGGAGLEATEFFYPATVVWSSGVNLAVVELDADTGRVEVLKYVFVHDSGEPLHPQVVEGQLSGGFAQGFGMAMGEGVVYAADGQLLSASLLDYYVPRATDVPDVDYVHFSFPTPDNPLGVKSVGESGPNAPPAALAAAIEDALGGAIEISSLPVRWSDILGAIRKSPVRQPEALETA
ncbi:carbon-monoxide dehydrogenase large subunit [Variovorax sp. HW608]|uniref:xanthine dehydrogenase family protein molybdopterin-binding subunit n=1 Tax=Variovorax sp. HW608 TaxID=1034889 RepID=UPI00082022C4|nr:xanthine dehydrogenase family protein molybdopterin-binding subunit [Variovorax sp. HW608]SCK14267.1 carbon-monoxide dehydrogenase large subunit [Variovorax sp. HW608]